MDGLDTPPWLRIPVESAPSSPDACLPAIKVPPSTPAPPRRRTSWFTRSSGRTMPASPQHGGCSEAGGSSRFSSPTSLRPAAAAAVPPPALSLPASTPSTSDWGEGLPEHLMEDIVRLLAERCGRQDGGDYAPLFTAAAVCRSWRAAVERVSPTHTSPWTVSPAGAAHPAQLLAPRPPAVAVAAAASASRLPPPPARRPHRATPPPLQPQPGPPLATGGHAGLVQCAVTRSRPAGKRGPTVLTLRLTGVPPPPPPATTATTTAAGAPRPPLPPPAAGAWSPSSPTPGKLLLAARLAPHREVTLHLDAACATPPVAVLARGGLGTRFSLRGRVPRVGGGAGHGRAATPRGAGPAPAAWAPLAGVAYQARLRGFMRPRCMAVSLCPPPWAAAEAGGGTGATAPPAPPAPLPPPLAAPPPPLRLINKAPHWNGALRCWCLNFRGRVKLASVKNFQLVPAPPPAVVETHPPPPRARRRARPRLPWRQRQAEQEGEDADDAPPPPPPPPPPPRGPVVVQFGKVDGDAYILDFDPGRVCAAAAFAAAVSMFGRSLT